MDTALKRATDIFKTLAHPCRLRLLLALSYGQICDVTTLINECGQRQPYVSQQLRVLRESGLVIAEPHGRRICYRLANPEVADLLAAVGLLDLPAANNLVPVHPDLRT
ncbi:MAG: ArsR/SmtB family transcription factor [Anaerolineae bacterium]